MYVMIIVFLGKKRNKLNKTTRYWDWGT